MSKRWEYKIAEGGEGWKGETIRKNSEEILNRFGLEGWECYAIKTDDTPTVFYLKRER